MARLVERVRRLRSGEQSPGSTGTSRKPDLISRRPSPRGTLGRPVIGHHTKSHKAVAFRFLRLNFSALFSICVPLVTLLFCPMEPRFPNSTCSRALSLCIIGFAYRAAEARSQNVSQARRNSRESIGFFCRVATAGPNGDVRWGQIIAV